VLPAGASVSVRLRAFDYADNVVEDPPSFTCEVTLIAAARSFGITLAYPGPKIFPLLAVPGNGIGGNIQVGLQGVCHQRKSAF